MKRDFWMERWERGEIAFHQNEINPFLILHWQDLKPAQGSKVFVPLCGKSDDMLWLRKQGHPVLGVELSAIAVQAFFKQYGFSLHKEASAKFDRYEAEGIHILLGDYFDLKKEDLSEIKVVYYRASLVALPPEMRERYVLHLAEILPPATQILLITFDYPQQEMPGPPFAVSESEVKALYRDHADIRLLSQHDVLDQNRRLKKRGLSRMQECIFLLTLR